LLLVLEELFIGVLAEEDEGCDLDDFVVFGVATPLFDDIFELAL